MPPFHRFNRLRRRILGLALTALAMLCVPGTQSLPILATLDASIHDSRTRLSAAQPDDRVLIVDVDEASMARLGRWPWDRSRVGELAAALVDKGGARVVGIDMVFAEPQREPGEDAALARQLSGRPIVLGYYFTRAADASPDAALVGAPLERTTGTLPPPVLRAQALTGLDLGVTSWRGFGGNLAALQARAAGAGFINPLVDPDATVRALPLLAEFRGALYESFAVAVLRQWLGSASLRLDADHLSLQGTRGSLALPLSDALTALVPFAGRVADERGPARRFAYIPAADVLEGRVDWNRFKDRVVLLGTSAPGLADLRATPIHLALPGVEIHATLIAAALASIAAPGDAAPADATPLLRSRSAVSVGLGVVAALIAGSLLAIGLPAAGALGALAMSVVVALSVWGFAGIAWVNGGVVMPVAAALVLVVVLLLLNLVVGYVVEGRARRSVAALFGEYLSPAVVERMVRDPGSFALGRSENRELTILFVDIRGFTRIAETMPPEHLREYIDAFLSAMTDVVHRYGGTVDKYIGDAVMAFWGAPLEDPQHADHAVAAALAMLEAVQRLNRSLEANRLPMMRVGIGVNTGHVQVGDMGSRSRRTYTAIGDAVNLAARFEALTKHYDCSIIVGEPTVARATGHRFVALGRTRIDGRAEPVLVYAPASLSSGEMTPGSGGAVCLPTHTEDRAHAGSGIGV